MKGDIMQFPLRQAESTSVAVTQMETKLLTLAEMNNWVLPPFQRDEAQNRKVIEFAEGLKQNGGMIGGVIHLGVLKDQDPLIVYLVDGQQRRNAGNMSGLEEFIADVCLKVYDSMAAMAEDFKNINSRLVALKPDDMLRAYEVNHPHLKQLREDCPFLGYSNVRRAEYSPVLSMSVALKAWFGSGAPTPQMSGQQAVTLLDQLTETQRGFMMVFLRAAHTAWGNDRQYHRLWSGLNLSMCMFLYRALVLEPNNRRVAVSPEIFRKCLMSVSANAAYCDWLQGRNISERDRSPCYRRLATIFAERLSQEYSKPFRMPKPNWVA